MTRETTVSNLSHTNRSPGIDRMTDTMEENTKCAPAPGHKANDIQRDFKALSSAAGVSSFNFFPLPLLILNECRQVVFVNNTFMQTMKINDAADFLGKLPGELMECVYADSKAAGCGTSDHCNECGALHAVLESIETDTPSTHDCQLLQFIDGEIRAKDLRVQSTPFIVQGKRFLVVTIIDIADEKAREAMERIFFHDILNSAWSMQHIIELVKSSPEDDIEQPLELIDMALFGMVEEIKTHREIYLAERPSRSSLWSWSKHWQRPMRCTPWRKENTLRSPTLQPTRSSRQTTPSCDAYWSTCSKTPWRLPPKKAK